MYGKQNGSYDATEAIVFQTSITATDALQVIEFRGTGRMPLLQFFLYRLRPTSSINNKTANGITIFVWVYMYKYQVRELRITQRKRKRKLTATRLATFTDSHIFRFGKGSVQVTLAPLNKKILLTVFRYRRNTSGRPGMHTMMGTSRGTTWYETTGILQIPFSLPGTINWLYIYLPVVFVIIYVSIFDSQNTKPEKEVFNAKWSNMKDSLVWSTSYLAAVLGACPLIWGFVWPRQISDRNLATRCAAQKPQMIFPGCVEGV